MEQTRCTECDIQTPLLLHHSTATNNVDLGRHGEIKAVSQLWFEPSWTLIRCVKIHSKPVTTSTCCNYTLITAIWWYLMLRRFFHRESLSALAAVAALCPIFVTLLRHEWQCLWPHYWQKMPVNLRAATLNPVATQLKPAFTRYNRCISTGSTSCSTVMQAPVLAMQMYMYIYSKICTIQNKLEYNIICNIVCNVHVCVCVCLCHVCVCVSRSRTWQSYQSYRI